MHVLLTGGTGQVGRFIAAAAREAGHRVTPLGRNTGEVAWSLADPVPELPAADALVHAAFHHRPGAYRGGEGDDPDTFWRLNHDGSLALFRAARTAGIPRWLFLSSRAVYGDRRRGETLYEADPPAPDSLYGELKLAIERRMAELADGRAIAIALRATGVYATPPGTGTHKWTGLFADHRGGRPVGSRCGTELHGADLADGALRCLAEGGSGPVNASDLMLDRHDLLERFNAITGCARPPPPRAAGPPPGEMHTGRLRGLGWQPGGWPRLDAFLRAEA